MEQEELKKMFRFFMDKITFSIEEKIEEEHLLYSLEENHSDILKDIFEAEEVKTGASKIVLFFDEFPDYVFKIPFKGEFDKSTGCSYDFIEDYCALEFDVYKDACREGLSEFFPVTDFVGWIGDIPLFVAERIEKNSYCCKFSNDSSRKRSTKLAQSLGCKDWFMDTRCLAILVDQYGITKVQKLISFFEDQGVDDFHEENFRITKDYKMKIIDFSGFNE